MICLRPLVAAGTLLALWLGANRSLVAQSGAADRDQLAVDVVRLNDGIELRGIVLKSPSGGTVTLAARSAWLQQHAPRRLERQQAITSPTRRTLYESLIPRIDNWLKELPSSLPQGPAQAPAAAVVNRAASDDSASTQELLRLLTDERQNHRQTLQQLERFAAADATARARQQAYRQLIARLDRWIAEIERNGTPSDLSPIEVAGSHPPAATSSQRLIDLLQKERDEFQTLLHDDATDGTPVDTIVQIEVPRREIEALQPCSLPRRRIGFLALQQELSDVETRPADELQQALTKAGLSAANVVIDGSLLAPVATPPDDREWAARRAVYEFQFGNRLEFQGTGNLIVRTGENAPRPQMAELLQGVLQEQLSFAVGDLLNDPALGLGNIKLGDAESWKSQAIRIAEQEHTRGFRVTRTQPDVNRRQVKVEDQFVACMPDGTWEAIWSDAQIKSSLDVADGDIDRILQDPQVSQALQLTKLLGLGGQGNINLAIRMGAATMAAQQAANDAFYEWRELHTARLDGPPLEW